MVDATEAPAPAKLSGAALWVAVFALAVWIAFSIALLFNVGRTETEWARLAWIFGSIQAVAFAAAGALFGTAVQQQNVAAAKDEAAGARKDADEQRDLAIKGRALAAVVQSEGAAPPATEPDDRERMGAARGGDAESAEAVRRRHAQLSLSLFGKVV